MKDKAKAAFGRFLHFAKFARRFTRPVFTQKTAIFSVFIRTHWKICPPIEKLYIPKGKYTYPLENGAVFSGFNSESKILIINFISNIFNSARVCRRALFCGKRDFLSLLF